MLSKKRLYQLFIKLTIKATSDLGFTLKESERKTSLLHSLLQTKKEYGCNFANNDTKWLDRALLLVYICAA